MAENNDKRDEIEVSDIDEVYAEDIDFWNKELEDTEILYKEMKQQYDNVRKKNSGTSGSYNFMMNQAENLVKLKEVKMKIAKERVNTKKIMTDTKLSIIRNRKVVEGEEAYAAIAKAMYAEIMNTGVVPVDVIPNIDNSEDNEEDVDAMLADRLEEIDARENEEREKINEEENLSKRMEAELVEISEEVNEVVRYVTNMDKVVIAVDDEYNEILGVPIPPEYQDIAIVMNDNDELIAVSNVTGEIIEIVEF